jgi:predicted dehydrogenase
MVTPIIRQAPPVPRALRPIAVIGAGGIVRDAHLPAYRKAGYPVASITDLDIAKARDLARRFEVPEVHASVEEAIQAAPDGAVFDVAVPASALLGIIRKLPPGAAVLMQKPMGEDLEQAGLIRRTCHELRLTAAVNFQLRFAPYMVAARELVQQGLLGELNDIEVRVTAFTPWGLWTFLEELSRVEILYHSIHYIDLIRSLVGDPQGVYAKTLSHPKAPKIANTRSTLILDYGDTVRANIETNHCHAFGARHQESYLKLEGSEGAVFIQAGLNMNYPEGKPDRFEYSLLADGKEPEWIELPLEGSWFPDGFIGSMGSLQQYLEASSDELPTGVDDAFKTMAVVEAAYLSSESGGTPIPYA